MVAPAIYQNIKLEYPHLAVHIIQLDPHIYQDGASFCCLSGPNPVEGVFGCGETEQMALLDWEINLIKKTTAS